MSDQMQEIIGKAIARAYESGAHNQRIKALNTIQALMLDAEQRLSQLQRGAGYLRQLHEIRTEIKIYAELKGKLSEQA